MGTISKDFIILLQYLVPGLIAAWAFYSFTSFPKQSPFERIVQALIFTIFIQASVYIVKSILFLVGNRWALLKWDINSELIWSIIIAILLGITFSYFVNNDSIHKKLRDWGITKETSYPSGWFGAFSNNITYVVLHFKDGKRLYGWLIEWPSDPEKGHFILEEASWLDDENKTVELTGVKSIMVDVKEINLVEFMDKIKENNNG